MAAIGWIMIVLGGMALLNAMWPGKRPSAVHDPAGYEQALSAENPGCGCLLLIIGILLAGAAGK